MIPAVIHSALRSGVLTLMGYLATWLAARGIQVPLELQDWVVQTLLVGAGVAAWTAGVRWLETRRGDRPPARAARALARLLMLGLARGPVYPPARPAPITTWSTVTPAELARQAPVAAEPGCAHPGCALPHPHAGTARIDSVWRPAQE